MLQHRVGRPQARRDVQFPSLLWDAGIPMSEPDPGRGGVGIRVEMPSLWLARVPRAYLPNDRQIGPGDRGVRWTRYAAILIEYAHFWPRTPFIGIEYRGRPLLCLYDMRKLF